MIIINREKAKADGWAKKSDGEALFHKWGDVADSDGHNDWTEGYHRKRKRSS